MKWVIRIFLLIIGSFALAAGVGYFTSPEINVERTIDVFAIPEDIFPFLSELEYHEYWSPWHDGVSHKGFQVGRSNTGDGQVSAWICETDDCLPGTEEIVFIQYPEYVQTELNLDGQSASAVYALMADNNDGSTTILLQVHKNAGGFPYVQRLVKRSEELALEQRLDRALAQLSELLIEDGLQE